jgi:hypothetical protein
MFHAELAIKRFALSGQIRQFSGGADTINEDQSNYSLVSQESDWTMRRTAFWITVLFVFHALLLAVIVVVGRSQALPDRVAHFKLQQCKLPCWIGIIPGETSLEEAIANIRSNYGINPENQIYIEAVWINIINKRLDMSLNISFEVDEKHVVQSLRIWQYMGENISFSELYSVLNPPHYLTTLPDFSFYVIALMNDDYTVGIILEQDRGGRIMQGLPVNRVILTSSHYTERYKLYAPLLWRGFRIYQRW